MCGSTNTSHTSNGIGKSLGRRLNHWPTRIRSAASFERRRGAHRLTAHGVAMGSISVDGGRMTEEASSGGGSCAVTPPMGNTPPIEGGGIRLFRI